MSKFFIMTNAHGGDRTRYQVGSREDCIDLLKKYPEFTKGHYVEEKLIFTEGYDFIRTYETIERFDVPEAYNSLTDEDLDELLTGYDLPPVNDYGSDVLRHALRLNQVVTDIPREKVIEYVYGK